MKKIALLGGVLVSLALASCGGGGESATSNGGTSGGGDSSYTGEKIVIRVDGGGDVGNFNTTASMTQSPLNPYPYNTLEKLIEEWEADHPKFDVQLLSTSSNGDRQVLVPQLENKTAPEITYQSGTVINSDLGKNYYVNMTSYLEKPNPYVEGNQHWKDIYNEAELATTMASDGDIYSINLERIPVGLMVNKTLLEKYGITENPTTYKDFVGDIKKLNSELPTTQEAYATTYMWYFIALETNMFSDLLAEGDVLRSNGKIDTEEISRLFTKGMWDPTINTSGDNPTFLNNKYYEYIKLCADLGKEKAPQSFDAVQNFIGGNLGFLEVTGLQIRNIVAQDARMNFDWEIIPFPDLTTDTYQDIGSPVVRGSAGLATSWFITNSAIAKGQETVDACADLLMFLTAPEQNNRMIGDLKGGMPLNPSDDFELAPHLQGLNDIYWQDIEKLESGERVNWAAFCSWEVLGYNFNTTFIRNMEDVQWGGKTPETCTVTLANAIKNTINTYLYTEGWDTSAW